MQGYLRQYQVRCTNVDTCPGLASPDRIQGNTLQEADQDQGNAISRNNHGENDGDDFDVF